MPIVVTLVFAPGTTVRTASVATVWSGADRPLTVNCEPPVNSIENCTGRMSGTRAAPITSTAAMMNQSLRRPTNGNEVLPV